jgi:hypothetical protein
VVAIAAWQVGGDVDQVAADGGAARPAVAAAGQDPGGAQQIMGDGGAGQPGGVGGELAGRQVRQRRVVAVGEDLLDVSATSASETQQPSWSSKIARG